jgi:riboflavin synthase
MFTGIIEAVGRVAASQMRQGDLRLRIETGVLDLSDVSVGDSIAVNGVCLTAVELPGDGFWADVSAETLSRSLFGDCGPGTRVNLEKSLLPTTRLGGHLVSGHVDGVGEVLDRRDDARSVRFHIRVPDALARFVAEKGSVCVDGTSLTVNNVEAAVFDVNIVPHTLNHTVMAGYQPGTRVHLEVDLIARYLERLLLGADAAGATPKVTLESLHKAGFAH